MEIDFPLRDQAVEHGRQGNRDQDEEDEVEEIRPFLSESRKKVHGNRKIASESDIRQEADESIFHGIEIGDLCDLVVVRRGVEERGLSIGEGEDSDETADDKDQKEEDRDIEAHPVPLLGKATDPEQGSKEEEENQDRNRQEQVETSSEVV